VQPVICDLAIVFRIQQHQLYLLMQTNMCQHTALKNQV